LLRVCDAVQVCLFVAAADHSVLSKARARLGSEVFAEFFRQSVELCRQAVLWVEDVLPELEEMPDAVILDPSCVGCHSDVIAAILRLAPPKLG
jgi:tRNA/tmRNA/rRNA uracil-C5-methylase (TrmA/RlmC/RlmD family)